MRRGYQPAKRKARNSCESPSGPGPMHPTHNCSISISLKYNTYILLIRNYGPEGVVLHWRHNQTNGTKNKKWNHGFFISASCVLVVVWYWVGRAGENGYFFCTKKQWPVFCVQMTFQRGNDGKHFIRARLSRWFIFHGACEAYRNCIVRMGGDDCDAMMSEGRRKDAVDKLLYCLEKVHRNRYCWCTIRSQHV